MERVGQLPCRVTHGGAGPFAQLAPSVDPGVPTSAGARRAFRIDPL